MTNQRLIRSVHHNRYAHDALRSMQPDEMRLARGRHSCTVTLITSSARQKRAFARTLPDGRKRVSCIQQGETSFWLVQAPSEEARRALRRLEWVVLPSSESSAEGRAEPLKSRPEEGSRPNRAPASRQNFRPCRPHGLPRGRPQRATA